ncbi:hypothetical protein CDAR_370811 [Caerostris darwini]|uniref:Uncharacterized protein n=1 Tax=Caerostris darwini TaxID=1538125 RepID=A0AAV4VHW9_9ARAC|nr:hypothetical protein CDAR_370811 [Caerostris darwini]
MDLDRVWMGEHGGNGDGRDVFGMWIDGRMWWKREWTGWIWNVDGWRNVVETEMDWMDLECGGNVDGLDEFGTGMDGGTWWKRGWMMERDGNVDGLNRFGTWG